MKTLSLLFILLTSTDVIANEQDQANIIYKDLGIQITTIVNMENAAKRALPNDLTPGETSKAMSYCNTGYFGEKASVGIPFGIGRNSSCLKGYQQIAEDIQEIIQGPAFSYLSKVYSIKNFAQEALSKLNTLNLDTENLCNSQQKNRIQNIIDEGDFWRYHTKEKNVGGFTTREAFDFLISLTANNRTLVDYINTDASSQKEKIQKGREVHLAFKTVRSSLTNGLYISQKYKVKSLISGCDVD